MEINIRKLIKDMLINNNWTERDAEHMLTTLVEDGYDATLTLKMLRMPFGKYKGISLKTLDRDNPNYLGWLLEQDWFEDKFDYLYKAIMEMGYTPSKLMEYPEEDGYLDTENVPF